MPPGKVLGLPSGKSFGKHNFISLGKDQLQGGKRNRDYSAFDIHFFESTTTSTAHGNTKASGALYSDVPPCVAIEGGIQYTCRGIKRKKHGSPSRTPPWPLFTICTLLSLTGVPSATAGLPQCSKTRKDQECRLSWRPPSLDILLRHSNATILSQDPVIMQFDNFLTEQETNHIIKLARPLIGRGHGCVLNAKEHASDKILGGISERIRILSNISTDNFESYSVLRKDSTLGQQGGHQDYASMPRIATFFMYLSTVLQGGETHFPKINVSIAPVRGRAALWWNFDVRKLWDTEHANDLEPDWRMFHAGQKVQEGEKWAVNQFLRHPELHPGYFSVRRFEKEEEL